MEGAGKWLGADCGNIKPMGAGAEEVARQSLRPRP